MSFDFSKGFYTFHRWRGDAHQVSTGIDTALNLCHSGIDITGIGIGHTLHTNGGVTAYCDITDVDFFGEFTFDGVMR